MGGNDLLTFAVCKLTLSDSKLTFKVVVLAKWSGGFPRSLPYLTALQNRVFFLHDKP